MKKIIGFSLIVWALVACEGDKKKADPNGCKTDIELTKNSTSRSFDEYYVKFTVNDVRSLYYLPKDSLPWKPTHFPQNGAIAHYFMDKPEAALSQPHIRIEYVARSLQNSSTTDSTFMWLKGLFINNLVNGKLITDKYCIVTQDGSQADLWAIYRPQHTKGTKTYGEKWMAWAYIQQGDYMVAFALTAFDEVRFKRGVEYLEKLVASYRKN